MNWDDWIRDGDCVVDVGANVGEYTKYFVERTDRVIAFEPNASVAKKCQATAPKADVRVMAVGEEDGETTMYLTEQHHTQGSRYLENNANGTPVTVPMTTLDTALAGLTVNGIKIDAQGGDGWVLVGAQETMSRMPKGSWLIFELWPEGMRRAGFEMGRLIPLCSGWSVVGNGKDCLPSTQTLAEIVQDLWAWTNGRHTNVFLRKT
jgi:FkbM family methyltransferase